MCDFQHRVAQVTTDFLDRLRQMKARMNGLKTKVETVRTGLRAMSAPTHTPMKYLSTTRQHADLTMMTHDDDGF